jgi:hypothetical protein
LDSLRERESPSGSCGGTCTNGISAAWTKQDQLDLDEQDQSDLDEQDQRGLDEQDRLRRLEKRSRLA